MPDDKQFLTKTQFSKLIEDVVLARHVSYMDAVLMVCEKHDIDVQEVRRFISPSIKDKLEAEARRLNFLPRMNTLPVD
jgi:hypothetical protein